MMKGLLTESDPDCDQSGDIDLVGLVIALSSSEASDRFDLYD
jgi:hypothetical protein